MHKKRNILVVFSLGFFLGAILGFLYGQHKQEKVPPTYEYSNIVYEPVWAEINFKYVSDDMLISQFKQHKDAMDGIIDEIKISKKECEPYNVFYVCSSNGYEGELKYVYQYYDGYEVEGTVLMPDYSTSDDSIPGKRSGPILLEEELVDVISHENITGKEKPMIKFVKYLFDQRLLASPNCFVKINVRTIKGTEEPLVQINLSKVQGYERNIQSYLVFYPNMPQNIVLNPLDGMERELVQLDSDWYFMKETVKNRRYNPWN